MTTVATDGPGQDKDRGCHQAAGRDREWDPLAPWWIITLGRLLRRRRFIAVVAFVLRRWPAVEPRLSREQRSAARARPETLIAAPTVARVSEGSAESPSRSWTEPDAPKWRSAGRRRP